VLLNSLVFSIAAVTPEEILNLLTNSYASSHFYITSLKHQIFICLLCSQGSSEGVRRDENPNDATGGQSDST
jgi:hypothetical protein